jgi:hypothetical protein
VRPLIGFIFVITPPLLFFFIHATAESRKRATMGGKRGWRFDEKQAKKRFAHCLCCLERQKNFQLLVARSQRVFASAFSGKKTRN